MSELYFLLIDQKQQGPYSLAYLRGILHKGEINQDTMAKSTDDEDWQTVGKILSSAPAPKRIVGAAMPDLSKPLPPRLNVVTPPLPKVPNPNYKGYNLLTANIAALKKYFNFSGRSTRSEFWYYYVTIFAAMKTLGLWMLFYGNIEIVDIITTISMALLVLFTVVPMMSISVRRLHDIGKSGWFVLLPMVDIFWGMLPVIYSPFLFGFFFGPGQIALLVLHCFDSKPGINRWDKCEKYQ